LVGVLAYRNSFRKSLKSGGSGDWAILNNQ
jgi:hypothetical protein